jgi:hypothetical protein
MLLEAKRMRKHKSKIKRKTQGSAAKKNLNRSIGEPSNAPRKSRMPK